MCTCVCALPAATLIGPTCDCYLDSSSRYVGSTLLQCDSKNNRVKVQSDKAGWLCHDEHRATCQGFLSLSCSACSTHTSVTDITEANICRSCTLFFKSPNANASLQLCAVCETEASRRPTPYLELIVNLMCQEVMWGNAGALHIEHGKSSRRRLATDPRSQRPLRLGEQWGSRMIHPRALPRRQCAARHRRKSRIVAAVAAAGQSQPRNHFPSTTSTPRTPSMGPRRPPLVKRHHFLCTCVFLKDNGSTLGDAAWWMRCVVEVNGGSRW